MHTRLRGLAVALCVTLTATAIVSCGGPEEKKMKFFNKGKALYEKGEYVKARLEFKNALQIDSKFAMGHYMLGRVEMKTQNPRGAFKAFSKAAAKFLVVSFTSDWLYPTYQSKAMVKAMKKNGLDVSFCEIVAECGHDAFLLPNERLTNLVKGFLERVYREVRH